MISGFPDVRYQFLDHLAYRGTPYVELLISSSAPAFLAAEAFDKQTNRVSTSTSINTLVI